MATQELSGGGFTASGGGFSVSGALTRLRRCGLGDLPADGAFVQYCRVAGHVWRERVLGPLATLRLMVLQVAWGNTAINHLRQLTGLEFSAGSYAQARARLPLAAIERLLAAVAGLAGRAEPLRPGQEPGTGSRVLAVDGTGFSMPDTPELRRHFGVPPLQAKGVGYPVGKLLGVMDLSGGLIAESMVMPLFTHDLRGLSTLHPNLRAGDVLVGDRAFCSVILLMLLGLRGAYGVFRLHQRRSPRGSKASTPLESGRVTWRRPKQRPVWLDEARFRLLPQQLAVRLIRHVITARGCRSRVVWLATTLPAGQWSDEQVIDLYRRRWEIETCFAHLKTSLKMNVLRCKSVDGVLKELTVYLLVYNLVRLILLRWAEQAGVDPRRVSLIDACRLLAVRLCGLGGCADLIVNPHRPGRSEPRRVRRRRKKFPLLMAPRQSYRCQYLQGKQA